MTLRQRLENLPVGQKLLAALLVLLVTILLVANLTFISAAYWITQESMAPQALHTIGRLVANPQLAGRWRCPVYRRRPAEGAGQLHTAARRRRLRWRWPHTGAASARRAAGPAQAFSRHRRLAPDGVSQHPADPHAT